MMGYYDNYLEHHGILGMKWGVRRFENANGHLTAAGKARYNTDSNGNYKKLDKTKRDSAKLDVKAAKANYKTAKANYKESLKKASKNLGNEEAREEFKNSAKELKSAKKELQSSKDKLNSLKIPMSTQKKVAIALAATGAVTVGVLAIKHHQTIKKGADKVEKMIRDTGNKITENRTASLVEKNLKKQEYARAQAEARVRGMLKPIADRRAENAKAAKDLLGKYYHEDSVIRSVKVANNEGNYDKAKSLIKNASSEGADRVIERWLKGETFKGEVGEQTYSLNYLKDLLREYGYKEKDA